MGNWGERNWYLVWRIIVEVQSNENIRCTLVLCHSQTRGEVRLTTCCVCPQRTPLERPLPFQPIVFHSINYLLPSPPTSYLKKKKKRLNTFSRMDVTTPCLRTVVNPTHGSVKCFRASDFTQKYDSTHFKMNRRVHVSRNSGIQSVALLVKILFSGPEGIKHATLQDNSLFREKH
jgi:hypothetical protein